MQEIEKDHPAEQLQPVVRRRLSYQVILIYLGSFCLLLSNIFPWPCLSLTAGSGECLPAIHIYTSDTLGTILHLPIPGWLQEALFAVVLSGIETAIFLAIGTLLIMLAIYKLKDPWNFLSWLSIWLIAYLLLIAELKPVNFGTTTYFPLIGINHELGGPASLIMPLSLIAFWAALRPTAIRKSWNLPVMIGLVILISLTSILLLTSGIRFSQLLQRASAVSYPVEIIFGAGPLFVLAGSLLLLGAEYADMRRTGRKSISQPEPTTGKTTSTAMQKIHQIGFWAASLVAVSVFLPFALNLIASRAAGMFYSGGDVFLISRALTRGTQLLQVISFVILVICLHREAPPEKQAWTRLGVLFACLYACARGLSLVTSVFFYLQIYLALYQIIPTLVFVLIGLAGWCIRPAFGQNGIELAIRRCLAIYAVLSIVVGIGYALSRDLPLGLSLAALISETIIFPLAMILIAVMFRRATRLPTA